MNRTLIVRTSHLSLRLSALRPSAQKGSLFPVFGRRSAKQTLGVFLLTALSIFMPAPVFAQQPDSTIAGAVEGRIDWARRASLRFSQSGIIEQVAVRVGDRVEPGQILLALDPAPFDAEVDAAQAELTRLDPDLQEGERELERAQDLFDRTLISDHELHLSRIALARLKAQQAQAQALLRLAQIRRERSVLRAPFAGIVIGKEAEIGEFFDPQLPAPAPIRIGDPSLLTARMLLPSDALFEWEKGLEVKITRGERSVVGHIRHIGIEAADATGSFYPAEVRFVPPPGFGGKNSAFRIGQTVEIRRK
ncbi:efflux RND transporter periplasmic adaptor subunit [Thioalkalivibrio sp. HK1]|uniref:efflux RND transporter periplasmic adaptor subunit n=1 Tax=Thioalkalivibrio sp. HK1 TaxID=1469245 RepID=UPI00046F735F|nr:efflux RND transporter periplasmic adaptor subunit [Thioalkalivibrio sp. HK1]